MAQFNPLAGMIESFDAAQRHGKSQRDQARQQQQYQQEDQQRASLAGLQDNISQQVSEGGFDPAESMDFQQLLVQFPERAKQLSEGFNQLSDSRKKTKAEDMQEGLRALENGDGEMFVDIMEDRIEAITELNGDPAQTKYLLNLYKQGDTQKLLSGLRQAEQAGMDKGFLKDNRKDTAAATSVQSSKILDDGTVIKVLKDGSREVTSNTGETLVGDQARVAIDSARDQNFNRKKDLANLKQTLDIAKEDAKTLSDAGKGIQKVNISRISTLADSAATRAASVRKATGFRDALASGNAFSGAGRKTAGFVPGVYTSQGQFDEKFNAFAEVAARQALKSAGEIRPTDADVQGMKQAMFGVGRDEDVNVTLLTDFINEQNDQTKELDSLLEKAKGGNLAEIATPASSTTELSDADLLKKYGG